MAIKGLRELRLLRNHASVRHLSTTPALSSRRKIIYRHARKETLGDVAASERLLLQMQASQKAASQGRRGSVNTPISGSDGQEEYEPSPKVRYFGPPIDDPSSGATKRSVEAPIMVADLAIEQSHRFENLTKRIMLQADRVEARFLAEMKAKFMSNEPKPEDFGLPQDWKPLGGMGAYTGMREWKRTAAPPRMAALEAAMEKVRRTRT